MSGIIMKSINFEFLRDKWPELASLGGVFIDENTIEELIGIINTFRPKATAPKERLYDIH